MNSINLTNTLGAFIIRGIDSKVFLQGQLTNDINLLDNEDYQYSAYLNNKGRMFASFLIKKASENEYYFITTLPLLDKIITRLKMYVLRAKVEIEKLNLNIIFTNNTKHDTGIKFKLPHHHYIYLTDENLDNSNTSMWKEFLINNGIPLIYPETQEQLIPQHVNFDELKGLNFKKGCYIGQEIVARMHYLGKSKRKMYRFLLDHEAKIGQIILSPKLNNQEIGTIIDITKRGKNYIGLVSLQNDCIEDAYLDLANQEQLLTQKIEY